MQIKSILCGAYGQNTYLIWEDNNDAALLVDAGDDLEAIRRALDESGKKLGGVLLTHGHFDHALAAASLQKEFGCPLYIHQADGAYLGNAYLSCYAPMVCRLPFTPTSADQAFEAGAQGTPLAAAGYHFTVYHTPGHTPGSVCYQPLGEDILFTGDTLFAQGYGRMDLPGGDQRQMAKSLQSLLSMPGHMRIYPGHGEMSTIERAGHYLW